MLAAVSDLPDDPLELQSVAQQLVATVKSQALRIAQLEHQLAGHRHHRFGSQSETLDQLQLRLEDEEITAAREAPQPEDGPVDPAAKIQPKRKPLPADLPREEEVLSPGDACNDCGGALKVLGGDITEELKYVPGRFVVKRFVCPRMAYRCCEKFVDLSGFTGWMHADGYTGFNDLRLNRSVQEVACMAHVRRKFVDIFSCRRIVDRGGDD